MTKGIHTACSLASTANRYTADNPPPSISPTKDSLGASLVSANNIGRTLDRMVKQPSSQKSESLFKRLIHFFKCKKPTTPQSFVFFGHTINFDAFAIRRSHPGDTSHIKASEQINKLDQVILDLRLRCGANIEASAKENECVYIIRELDDIFLRLGRIEPQLMRLKAGFGKNRAYDTGLNSLIDNCTCFGQELDMMITSYRNRQRPLSTEKINQICSLSSPLCEKTEKLLKKTNNNKFRNKAYYEPQKKSLIEKIEYARTALEQAGNTIENNRSWYSRHERMEVNIAFTAVKEAARRLNFGEYERSLNDVALLTIPRAKLKSPNNPT